MTQKSPGFITTDVSVVIGGAKQCQSGRGVRLLNSGTGQPEVIAGTLAAQVKTCRTAPMWLLDAVDQAGTNG